MFNFPLSEVSRILAQPISLDQQARELTHLYLRCDPLAQEFIFRAVLLNWQIVSKHLEHVKGQRHAK